MNSIYHISDVIQFISDYDQYVILDPLCKYYPDADYTNPGRRLDAKKFLTPKSLYSDIYAGFNFMPLEKSTMFRFPLRNTRMINKEKFLSASSYSIDKITTMMLEFAKNQECLLFLKNVKKISFFENDSNNNLRCLQENQISFENNDELRWNTFQQNLISQMKKNLRFTQLQSHMISCDVSIESSSLNKMSLKKYHVRHQFGFGNDLNNEQLKEINDLYDKKTTKFFPLAGIAINLDLFNSENYKLYSFLPLNQESPLSCHINGYWALKDENRSELFENSSLTNIMESNKAKWCQQWNKALIDYIIMPMYVDSMQNRKLPIPDLKTNKVSKILRAYWKTFPQSALKFPKLKDYFSTMFKEFYKQIHDKETIPIYSQYENDFKLHCPSKLLFSTRIEENLSNKPTIDKVEMESIIHSVVKTFCIHTELIRLFKSIGSIELKVLDEQSLLNAIKDKSYQYEGLKIEDSIFKTLKNLKFILNFCVKEEKDIVSLNDIPLMVNYKNILKKFTKNSNRPFYISLKYYDEVIEYQPSIELIHKDMYDFGFLVNEKSPFFKNITLVDLSLMLPNILGGNYKINPGGIYPESSAQLKNKIELIWRIIFDCMRYECSENSSRLDKVNWLKIIQNWTIIPVKCEKKIQLAPLIDIEDIFSKQSDYSLLCRINEFYIVNELYFKDTELQKSFKSFTDTIAMDFKNASDFITVLFNKSRKIESFESENANRICEHLNKLLIPKYIKKKIIYYFDMSSGLKTETELLNMLSQIKIFEEYNTGNLVCLNCMSKIVEGSDRMSSDNNYLKDYCQSQNVILIENSILIENLYEYLNINKLDTITLHMNFLSWCNATNDKIRLHKHMEIIKNSYSIISRNLKKDNQENFLNFLKEIKFIELNSNFFKPSDMYSRNDQLFSAAFPNKLLPKEYDSIIGLLNNWMPFLIQLGFNKRPNLDQLLQISSIFSKKYENGEVDLKYMKKCSEMLLSNVQQLSKFNNVQKNSINQHKEFVDKSKCILFIPSYFKTVEDSVYSKMFKSVGLPLITCIENSYLEDSTDLIWLTHSILPNFCDHLMKNYRKANLIPTCAQVVNNFIKMVDICSDNFLQTLSAIDLNQLEKVFYKNYRYFNNALKNQENSKTLGKLSEILLGDFTNQFGISRMEKLH